MDIIVKTEEKARVNKLLEFTNSLTDKEREVFEVEFENFKTAFRLAQKLSKKIVH